MRGTVSANAALFLKDIASTCKVIIEIFCIDIFFCSYRTGSDFMFKSCNGSIYGKYTFERKSCLSGWVFEQCNVEMFFVDSLC